MCVLTCAIGIERSQNGSNIVEQKPQAVQVRQLFSCPTKRSASRMEMTPINEYTGHF